MVKSDDQSLLQIPGFGPIQVYKTAKPEDLDSIFRLRYYTYCLELQTEPRDEHPDEREKDQWDEEAFQFIAKNIESGEIVGCLRLIPKASKNFPMESVFKLPSALDKSQGLEASRATVAPPLRRRGAVRVIEKLDEVAQDWSRENGFHWWCVALREHLLDSKRRQGWNMWEFGPAAEYHGLRVVPLIVLF